MIKGLNKADIYEDLQWIIETKTNSYIKTRPCVFISHKKEDKEACRQIAKYLSNAEIDYYLDENDKELQRAAEINNPHKITESIKKGIRNSTHMLAVISQKTYLSQWVPFEIGYGQSAIIDNDPNNNNLKLSVLTLEDISEQSLPDYLQIANIIRGTKTFNQYISNISNKLEKSLINESRVFSHSNLQHPLDNILNWKL
jgi:hypothetical protein